MESDLLTPATADLLEGWTGPVVARDRAGGDEPAIVDGDNQVVWLLDGSTVDYNTSYLPVLFDDQMNHVEILLDLSRAECRDRVARCLAVRLYPAEAPFVAAAVVPGRRAFGWPEGLTFGLSVVTVADGERWRAFDCDEVAALDPSDDTHLPDGSRRVDALALQLCWEASRG